MNVAALPVVSWFRVATLAAATVPEVIVEPLRSERAEPSPLKPEETKRPVLELKVRFDPLFGARSPVAPVVNMTLHVVSVDSSATPSPWHHYSQYFSARHPGGVSDQPATG